MLIPIQITTHNKKYKQIFKTTYYKRIPIQAHYKKKHTPHREIHPQPKRGWGILANIMIKIKNNVKKCCNENEIKNLKSLSLWLWC